MLRAFGNPKVLGKKAAHVIGGEHINVANTTSVQNDLDNQEAILKDVYEEFPELEISVEERLDNPTKVQLKFYENDGKSEYLLQLDALDGSYAFKEGLREDFGIIASVLQRTRPGLGKFVLAVFYYPAYNQFIVANENGVFIIEGDTRRKISRPKPWQPSKEWYSAVFHYDKKRLKFDGSVEIIQDQYSCAQLLLDLIKGKISGFLASEGHLFDYTAAMWVAQQWGADVAYANGSKFEEFQFGDAIEKGLRVNPRDMNGTVIVGVKNDGIFEKYLNAHLG